MSGELLDVNILLALLIEDHIHHGLVLEWYRSARRTLYLCCFTEAGFLRNATVARPGQMSVAEASSLLAEFTRTSECQYLSVATDWHTLSSPFSARLQGTKQITDAYLLGLAVRHGLTLVTLDRGILHLAGREYVEHVLLLEP